MLNKKGSALIESLFAFEIYICILIVFVSLFITVFQQEAKISKHYQVVLEKEGEYIFQDSFIDIVEMVLHS